MSFIPSGVTLYNASVGPTGVKRQTGSSQTPYSTKKVSDTFSSTG